MDGRVRNFGEQPDDLSELRMQGRLVELAHVEPDRLIVGLDGPQIGDHLLDHVEADIFLRIKIFGRARLAEQRRVKQAHRAFEIALVAQYDVQITRIGSEPRHVLHENRFLRPRAAEREGRRQIGWIFDAQHRADRTCVRDADRLVAGLQGQLRRQAEIIRQPYLHQRLTDRMLDRHRQARHGPAPHARAERRLRQHAALAGVDSEQGDLIGGVQLVQSGDREMNAALCLCERRQGHLDLFGIHGGMTNDQHRIDAEPAAVRARASGPIEGVDFRQAGIRRAVGAHKRDMRNRRRHQIARPIRGRLRRRIVDHHGNLAERRDVAAARAQRCCLDLVEHIPLLSPQPHATQEI